MRLDNKVDAPTSCEGCKHRILHETKAAGELFVTEKCGEGSGRPLYTEFALKSSGRCGPARRLYAPKEVLQPLPMSGSPLLARSPFLGALTPIAGPRLQVGDAFSGFVVQATDTVHTPGWLFRQALPGHVIISYLALPPFEFLEVSETALWYDVVNAYHAGVSRVYFSPGANAAPAPNPVPHVLKVGDVCPQGCCEVAREYTHQGGVRYVDIRHRGVVFPMYSDTSTWDELHRAFGIPVP